MVVGTTPFLRFSACRLPNHRTFPGVARRGLGYSSDNPLELSATEILEYTDPRQTMVEIVSYISHL